jgi:hypothetical protein
MLRLPVQHPLKIPNSSRAWKHFLPLAPQRARRKIGPKVTVFVRN